MQIWKEIYGRPIYISYNKYPSRQYKQYLPNISRLFQSSLKDLASAAEKKLSLYFRSKYAETRVAALNNYLRIFWTVTNQISTFWLHKKWVSDVELGLLLRTPTYENEGVLPSRPDTLN